jgi:hypothetical protein
MAKPWCPVLMALPSSRAPPARDRHRGHAVRLGHLLELDGVDLGSLPLPLGDRKKRLATLGIVPESDHTDYDAATIVR